MEPCQHRGSTPKNCVTVPWRTADQVELATLEWVQWWNQQRLHGALDHIPPAEHEAIYYRGQGGSKEVA